MGNSAPAQGRANKETGYVPAATPQFERKKLNA